MNMNKLTPGKNLRWESSRMILPEHREQILKHQKNLKRNSKPILDEQHLQELSNVTSNAITHNLEVSITVFDPFEKYTFIGKISNIDQNKIKVVNDDGTTYIPLSEVIDVRIV